MDPDNPDSAPTDGPPVLLTVETAASGADAVVTLAGELDLAGTTQVAGAIADLLDGPCTSIRVDAAALTFLDSAGLTTLARAKQQADAQGVAFHLDPVSQLATRVIEIGGLAAELLPDQA
jgi:anti-anti-sigma factor